MSKKPTKNSKGFSFIIPYREKDNINNQIANIKSICQKLKILFEIIIVSGENPSLQRNVAVEYSKKKYLYFLDNDSRINQKSLKVALMLLDKEPEISVLGGPSLLLKPASYFEECVQGVLSSKLVVNKIAARYSRIGKKRWTNDLEIILCNLIIRKDLFYSIGGFNIKLYPNEENDLVSRILKINQKVCYHPEVFVEKPHRKSMGGFIRQMIDYGNGRAEQIKLKWINKKFTWFLLLIFVFISFFLFLTFVYNYFFLVKDFIFLYTIYLLYIFSKTSFKRKKFLFYTPLITFCCHFFYFLGLALGIIKKSFKSEKRKDNYSLKIIN